MDKKFRIAQSKRSLSQLIRIDWTILTLVVLLSIFSLLVTWSACGQNDEVLMKKFFQIVLGIVIMLSTSQVSPKRYEKYSPYLYMFNVFLLIFVFIFGHSIKGAQRWVSMCKISFQPSELSKITVPLVMSRMINRDSCPIGLKKLMVSLFLIGLPTVLVAMQPDLGTSILIAFSGISVLFFSGISWRKIIFFLMILLCSLPYLWFFTMHEYQKGRIITLLSPESDPLGSGYHIIQSKIAIGSGGLFGKGLFQGTQSNLNFLPEKHTDFVFSVLAEEFGLFGVLSVMVVYISLIFRGMMIAINSKNSFGMIIVATIMSSFFACIFVNIGMVSGILPVVGIPLPMMSYGGSSLVEMMIGLGITVSIHTHKKFLSHEL
ncbi:rod shape-determining protein RodA [Candidatus Riesia pediculischaeffi]|uniref:Peptidoglycan glycosyltransferase MrdB n=1 Tax=Candidatus Riesia pediculischaeffi PTSU TaxID=1401651 RepID=A0A0C1V823_9ENTR|nr:rod shape-determining protein RodA [Candidatus Riesia pediculischaeffi]KIE63998.1 Rod shape-determining protein RodA [Candidatus Riesia pediculischaeffi PTSU]